MKKKVVLIVEDEKEIVKSMEHFLQERLKCVVFVAYDGIKAVELIKKNDFDLIILDIKMPGKSGLEVVKEVRKTKNLPPILVVTGHNNDQVLHEAMELGVSEYITKPFEFGVFHDKVKELLNGQK